MGDRPLVAIEELVEDILDRRGVTPIKLGSYFTAAGHRVISAKLVKSGAINLDADEPRYVDERTYARWMRSPLRADDVILTSEAPLGEVAYLRSDVDWVLGQRLFALRTDKRRLHGRYLYYALQTDPSRSDLQARATGTTAQGVRQTELRRVRIPLPPLSEQRRIAGILGGLDDKIELNRRTSGTLQVMARALFDRWFLRSEASRAWPIEPLADHVEVVRGLSYKGDGLASVGMPLHNLNSVSEGGGYKPDGIKWYTGPYAERHVVEPGDVIVTNTEQGHDRLLIGHAALVPRSFGDLGLFSHHLYRVRPKPGSVLSRSFVAYLLNSATMHDLISGYSNGTTVQMLPAEALQQPAIPIPPSSLIERFDAIATLVHERDEVLRGESRSLATLRDAFLPRLLSGSIEVTE